MKMHGRIFRLEVPTLREADNQLTCFPFLLVVITGRTIVVVPVWMTAFCTCPDVVTAIGDDAFFGGVCGGIVMVVVSVVATSSSS